MDVKRLVEGNNVSVELVKDSQSKKAVFLSEGSTKEYEGREKAVFLMEMDGKQLTYTANKTSLKRIVAAYGTQTDRWIGKIIRFETALINGKEAVIASPFQEERIC